MYVTLHRNGDSEIGGLIRQDPANPRVVGWTFEDDGPMQPVYPPVLRTLSTVTVPWNSVSAAWDRVVDACVVDPVAGRPVLFGYRGSNFGHRMRCVDDAVFEELQRLVISIALSGSGTA